MFKIFLSQAIMGCIFAGATAQNMGIGTITPTQKLEVNGTIKTNGLQMQPGAAAGKILKSDANGTATWGSLDAGGLFNSTPSTDVSCPTLLGSVGTGNGPNSVAIAGNFAYVLTQGSNTLQIINISNPAIPVVVGSLVTGTEPISLAVLGNYAYVVDYINNTLQVINITNPVAPILAGSVGTGMGPASIAVEGSYAYVVNYGSNNLQVINISNPAAPVIAGSVNVGLGPASIAVVGNYAYVVNFSSNSMQVINISNPAAPVVAGSVATGSNPQAIRTLGNFAYVINQVSNTMQVINISNPASPVSVISVATPPMPVSIAVSGNYAYIVSQNIRTLQVINITNPVVPVLAGSVSTGVTPRSVAVGGNLIYIVNATSNNMQVFNRTACLENYTAGYNIATGQTNAIKLPWNANGSNIYNSNYGNVGIGTTAPTAKLSVNGTSNNLTGSWAVFSDERIKTIKGEFTDGLNVINKINSIWFTYNADAPFAGIGQQVGVVAQELEKIAPYMISKTKTGKYDDLREVNNQAYPFLLINAVKELATQGDLLKAASGKQQTAIDKQKYAAEQERIAFNARLQAIEDKLNACPAAALTTKKK